jgi:hypothetical protein
MIAARARPRPSHVSSSAPFAGPQQDGAAILDVGAPGRGGPDRQPRSGQARLIHNLEALGYRVELTATA